jgi:hypothetical protein
MPPSCRFKSICTSASVPHPHPFPSRPSVSPALSTPAGSSLRLCAIFGSINWKTRAQGLPKRRKQSRSRDHRRLLYSCTVAALVQLCVSSQKVEKTEAVRSGQGYCGLGLRLLPGGCTHRQRQWRGPRSPERRLYSPKRARTRVHQALFPIRTPLAFQRSATITRHLPASHRPSIRV